MMTDGSEPPAQPATERFPLILEFGEPLGEAAARAETRITKVERETTDDD